MRHVKSGQRRTLEVGGIFIFIGFTPNTDMLAPLSGALERDSGGHIVTNHFMETGVPGLYAARDIQAQLARQVTTAVGDATTARHRGRGNHRGPRRAPPGPPAAARGGGAVAGAGYP